MKKKFVIGMVLAATMSFSSAYAGVKSVEAVGFGKRVTEAKEATIKAATGGAGSLKGLSEAVQHQRQEVVVKELKLDRDNQVLSYLREDSAKMDERFEIIVTAAEAKKYAAELRTKFASSAKAKSTAEHLDKVADAVVKIVSNSSAARDRGDAPEGLAAVERQLTEALTDFSPEAQSKFASLANKYDANVTAGMPAAKAWIKAIEQEKGVDEAQAKKIDKEMAKLCKKG